MHHLREPEFKGGCYTTVTTKDAKIHDLQYCSGPHCKKLPTKNTFPVPDNLQSKYIHLKKCPYKCRQTRKHKKIVQTVVSKHGNTGLNTTTILSLKNVGKP